MLETATFVLALIAVILGAVGTVLHFIAPRTKTTVDDVWAARFDEMKAFVEDLVKRLAKPAATLLVVVCFGALLGVACSWVKSEAQVAKKAAIDCTTSTAHDAIKQFGPILDALLVQATTPDGKVNWQPVKDLGKGLGAELGGCVLATVVAHELAPAPPDPNAPKAAELVLDAASLRAGFNEIRNAQFGGATFKTDVGPL